MSSRVKEDSPLAELVRMAIPLCQQAERECPRTGPGRKPEIPDWVMAVLIMIAVLKRKKSKSAQYRFLKQHQRELAQWLGTDRFPSRSTYFERYRRAHRLFRHAIRLQGQVGVAEGVADAQDTAADKSLIAARGPLSHRSDRKKNRIPKGLRSVDRDSDWGYSKHDGCVQGYSYEVLVTCTKNSTLFPLLASADTASAKETRTFLEKVDELPEQIQTVSADSGYDSNRLAERVEWTEDGHRTGRRFLCPENRRNPKRERSEPVRPRDESHRRRLERRRYFESEAGQAIYARRSETVEPFHTWFKSPFELEERVWHRGLDNNRTQLLAALFAYQLLVRYNYRCGNRKGRIRWILDAL